MVRINILPPKCLTDQHLIAEYNEILMLLGYVKKHSNEEEKIKSKKIPEKYCLGKGHILFFKNKLNYLKKRFNKIKKEMRKRGFNPTKDVNLTYFNKNLRKKWKPSKKDKEKIKNRLIKKIDLKPDFYTYYRKKKPKRFYEGLLKKATL